MKPPPIEYVRAENEAHALALLAELGDDAQVLAGGQSLMPLLAMRLAAPSVVVDINRLANRDGIVVADGRVRIGALTRHRSVHGSAALQAAAPMLPVAAGHVAHAGIRNRGTFGGSLAFNDPAAEFPACLLALGGHVTVRSLAGERRIAMADFTRGLFETALAPGELVVEADFPAARPGERQAFAEFARRHADPAVAGVAVRAHVDGGRLSDVSIACLGISDRVLSAPNAAAALTAGGAGGLAGAVAALRDELDVTGSAQASAAMRRHVVGTLLERAVAHLLAA